MDEWLLRELTIGKTTLLSASIWRNNILQSTDSSTFINLATCLAETYRRLWDEAATDEQMLYGMGIVWLYMDGDTDNSDYDIIADINRINSILFTEELDYIGRIHQVTRSLRSLSEGVDVQPIHDGSIWAWWWAAWSASSPLPTTEWMNPTSIWSLWIGDICTPGWQPRAIAELDDERFARELEMLLASGNRGNWWVSYGPEIWWEIIPPGDIWEDFFNTPPCTDSFCIRVRTVPWTLSLIWWRTYSIESILDKHIGIMTPIANSNLSAQEHNRNSYQIPFINVVFKNKIPPRLLHTETRPQETKKYEEEYTQHTMDKEFDELQRCAYASAWLPSDRKRANILWWVWYQKDVITNSDNIWSREKYVSIIDPADSYLQDCMDIALGQSRKKYYQSFSQDLTELERFSAALVDIVSRGIEEHKALDKKKVH